MQITDTQGLTSYFQLNFFFIPELFQTFIYAFEYD